MGLIDLGRKKKFLLAAGSPKLKPQDFFAIGIGTASQFDSVDKTGWDTQIGKSRVNATNWAWGSSTDWSKTLASNTTEAEATFSTYAAALGSGNGVLYRLKKKAKAFDRVEYVGNGVAGRQIPHSLGIVPGMVIIKDRTTTGPFWLVNHRSIGATDFLALNNTDAKATSSAIFNAASTATYFQVGTSAAINQTGDQYVAYLFAQNPDLIDCGSYVQGSGDTPVTCGSGWKPQFLIEKPNNSSGGWYMSDAARGWNSSTQEYMRADLSSAPSVSSPAFSVPTSTGFISKTGNFPFGISVAFLAIREPY